MKGSLIILAGFAQVRRPGRTFMGKIQAALDFPSEDNPAGASRPLCGVGSLTVQKRQAYRGVSYFLSNRLRTKGRHSPNPKRTRPSPCEGGKF